MKKILFLICFCIGTFTGYATGGDENNEKITGKVIDAETGDELTGVRVEIIGSDKVTYTDRYGNFIFEELSQDESEIQFSFISFEELTVSASKLLNNKTPESTVQLTSR